MEERFGLIQLTLRNKFSQLDILLSVSSTVCISVKEHVLACGWRFVTRVRQRLILSGCDVTRMCRAQLCPVNSLESYFKFYFCHDSDVRNNKQE